MSNINEFEPITLERILSHGTMVEAIKRVIANKGGAGVDGMKTHQKSPVRNFRVGKKRYI